MKAQWKTLSLIYLLSAALSICGIPHAWSASPELDAAEKAITQAKALFSQTPYDEGSPLQQWFRELYSRADETAREAAENTVYLMESKRGTLTAGDASGQRRRAAYLLAYTKQYQNTLDEKMREPENAARYQEMIAPVLASLALLRETLPILEKYDTELKKRHFARTSKKWQKQIDDAERKLLNYTDIKPTLMTIEHGIIPEMEAGLRIARRQ